MKNLSSIGFAAFLTGCSIAPVASPPDAGFGEQVVFNERAGNYGRYIVEDMHEGKPININITLSNPRTTTQWAATAVVCASGEGLSDQSCVWFAVDNNHQTMHATVYHGTDGSITGSSDLPYHSQVGKTMKIALKLEPNKFSVHADGDFVISKSPGFEINGYSFGCVSATCTFGFAE